MNQRTQTRTQSRTRARQPSQQPSAMVPPLTYMTMREGDAECGNVNSNNDNQKSTKKRATLSITSLIPTSTGITATVGTISLNNDVEDKMIADLQDQHVQMRQMQQQHHQVHQQSSPFTATAIIPSSMTMMNTITAATTTDNMAGVYDKLHDDLTYVNIQLLRSKLSFLHRLLPKNKKQIDRFVNFLT